MNNRELIRKLRRLHTLLIIGKRSNNLALAIRKAIEYIASWQEEAPVILAHTPVKRLFAGYGPKFIKIFNELMETGQSKLLNDLQIKTDPFYCELCEVPTIGLVMAERMYFDYSIRSMDDLRIANTNRVLQNIPAFGEQRLRAIEAWLCKVQDEAPAPQENPRRNVRIFPSTTFRPPQQGQTAQTAAPSLTSPPMDGAQIDAVIRQNPDIFGKSEISAALEAPKANRVPSESGPQTLCSDEIVHQSQDHQTVTDMPSASQPTLCDEIAAAIEANQNLPISPALDHDIAQFVQKDLALAADGAKNEENETAKTHWNMTAEGRLEALFVPCLQAKFLQAGAIYAREIQGEFVQIGETVELERLPEKIPVPVSADLQKETLACDAVYADLVQGRFIQTRIFYKIRRFKQK